MTPNSILQQALVQHQAHLTRRWFFRDCGVGLGMAALHCLLYTSPSPRDVEESRMPSSA